MGPALVGVALAVWAFAPLLWLVLKYAPERSPTGAAGLTPVDELQYMAWISDASRHWLSASLWGTGALHHTFLHPMYALSGLLMRLGVSVQVAYLVWKPVAVIVLVAGFAAYTERRLASRRQALAALVLALFYLTPAYALIHWGHVGAPSRIFDLALVTNNLFPAGATWGQLHAAITFGLVPVFLLGLERLLARDRPGARPALVGAVAAAGLLVAWLRPWQGATLIAISVGLAAWRRERRGLLLLGGLAAATALPLLYYFLLGHLDPAWQSASERIGRAFPRPWALAAALLPLAAVAALGVSRARARDDGERILLLWPAAATLVLLVSPTHVVHALGGVTLPLAVLAVRGWSRFRIPAAVSVAALLVVTLPSAASQLDQLRQSANGPLRDEYALAADDAATLDDLAKQPGSAGVLAPPGLALSIPARTGRQSFVGHPAWTPPGRDLAAYLYFNGVDALIPRIRATGLGFVLAGCESRPALRAALARAARAVGVHGCAALYEVPGGPAR